jgi:hypothetical protein
MLPHRHREHWHRALDARLELLWASGKSLRTIAAILTEAGHSVTHNAIAGRRRRLGLSPRGSPLGRKERPRAVNDNAAMQCVA